MRRRAGLVLLALAVFFAALSPLLRWYAFPRLAKIPPNQYQDMVLEAKDATLLDYGTMKAKKVPKVTIVQTLKGNVEASEKIETQRRPGRRRLGRALLHPGPRRQDGLPDPRALHLRRPHPGPRPRHRRDGRRRPGHAARASSSSGPSSPRSGTTSTSTPRARTTAPIHYKGTRTSAAWRSTTSSRPSPGPRSRSRRRCPSRASPAERSPRPARPAGTPRSASSGSTRHRAPSTARRSTRRSCAAARCSAAATRSPPSPAT